MYVSQEGPLGSAHEGPGGAHKGLAHKGPARKGPACKGTGGLKRAQGSPVGPTGL